MRTVAIIQARMGSTRLPGKAMLPLAGAPMTQRLIERVKRAVLLDDVVLALPNESDSPLMHLALQIRIKCYCRADADSNDLVGRYVAAADFYDADLIVRIPGDNPCIEPNMIDAAIELYREYPYLYFSNTTTSVEYHGRRIIVDGLGCEVFSRSRLEWLDERTRGCPEWREHPHQYFYDHGILSHIKADLRLDVNTQADYKYISAIYDACYPKNSQFTIEDILGSLPYYRQTAQHKEVIA